MHPRVLFVRSQLIFSLHPYAGANITCSHMTILPPDFNSRPPAWGANEEVMLIKVSFALLQLTPPRVGELDAEENGPQWADASTHAPVLGRTFQTLHAGSCQTATTLAPRVGRTSESPKSRTQNKASTPAPVWRRTAFVRILLLKMSATTHAPVCGGERAPVVAISSAMQLQLTPPRGGANVRYLPDMLASFCLQLTPRVGVNR